MNGAGEKANILVVDDDERIRHICTTFLSKVGHEVTAAEGADTALREVQKGDFDIVLTDIKMPGIRGDVLIDRLKVVRPQLASVIMTGFPTMELAIAAVGKGVCEFITKPFKLEDLKNIVAKVLEDRAAEIERTQRSFAQSLLAMEKELGGDFQLELAIETVLGAQTVEHEPTSRTTSDAADAEPSPADPPAATRPDGPPGKPIYVVMCEPSPKDKNALRSSHGYHHFRTVYAAQKILNSQLQDLELPVDIKLMMASHSSDIPKHFRRHADDICCVIFGPNLPRLSEATVRMMGNSADNRQTVVCYNPDQVNFSWDDLEELAVKMDVKGCRADADANDIRVFWTRFFTQELKTLVEDRARAQESDNGDGNVTLSANEIRLRLERDQQALEMLPGFPHICRQVMDAIEAGKRYSDVASIIQPDGALQASIIRTSNLARYGARQRIETLPNALSMIGMEETKKIVMGSAMNDLMKKVDQAGFNTKDFFLHSTTVGYLCQLLSLNVEKPSPREKEILQSLRMPNYVDAALRPHRLWERFPLPDGFDAFTAGILHDTGKVLNTVCYQDIFPLVLYEYERAEWKGSLLQGEISVVGDFQHPATGGALLERWEVFPELIEPIRDHHRIGESPAPEVALIALANCLSKGTHPFPRAIAIADEFRSHHLGPIADEGLLDNPLMAAYQLLAAPYDQARSDLDISPDEIDSGEYSAAHVEGLVAAARVGAASGEAVTGFVDALVDQNPEFLFVQELTQSQPEDLLALSLLLKDFVSEVVNGLFQGTKST